MKLIDHDEKSFFIFVWPVSIEKFKFICRLFGFSILWALSWWLYTENISDYDSAFIAFSLGVFQLPVFVILYGIADRKLKMRKSYIFGSIFIVAIICFYPLLWLTYAGLAMLYW